MAPPAGRLHKPVQGQLSINSVSISTNWYQVGCLFKALKCQKVTFSSDSSRKNGVLAVSGSEALDLGLMFIVHWSRINVHWSLLWHIKLAEAKQLLGSWSSRSWACLCNSKAVSSGRDFLKLYYNRQERFRQKMIQVIPSHFNTLKRNWQKPLIL